GPPRTPANARPVLQPPDDQAANLGDRNEVRRAPAAEHIPVAVADHGHSGEPVSRSPLRPGHGRGPATASGGRPASALAHRSQAGWRGHGARLVSSCSASSMTWYAAAATGGSVWVR